MLEGGEAIYHAYSFASVRQIVASFELLASYLTWLDGEHPGPFAPAASAFLSLSKLSKTLILKLARIVHSKRTKDLTPGFVEIANAWERGMEALRNALDS